MTENHKRRILLVDDDLNVLKGYQRQLHKRFHTDVAQDGESGLRAIERSGPYAVVISDLRMPGMNGIEFLSRVRGLAPDTVRMMLTGYAEIQTAVDAVNEGNVFRFLTKPCSPDVMINALDDGLHQYQLVMAERELLEQTLKGTIKVLTDVLSLVNPEAFGRASRITRYVREVAGNLGKTLPTDMWVLETAAMLSQVGWILMPEESIQKLYGGEPFTAEEHQIFQMHPGIARDLLARIPRLEPVAEMVYYQEKGFDGSGIPLDTCRGDAIPLGGRILKAVLDFDISVTRGETPAKAFIRMREKTGLYDPLVLEALEKVLGSEARFDLKTLTVPLLKEKMILAEDLFSLDSTKKILSKGHEMTATILEHLRNYQSLFGLREPIRVFVPLPEPS